MKHILFVCTGNTCRSPMAEAMLRKLAEEAGLSLEVRSAGVAAMQGSAISKHAMGALRAQEIHAEGAASSPLSEHLVLWADLILTMTSGHKQHVVQSFPKAVDKTYTLKEYVEVDEQVLLDLQELEERVADWHIRHSLGEQLPDEEKIRIIELQQRIPSFDISDPFGGSLERYQQCAAEIRTALLQLLARIERESQ